MTLKEKYAVTFLAYALVDHSSSKGDDYLKYILNYFSLTAEGFLGYIENLPKGESGRFKVYDEVRCFSASDKGLVRSVIFNAYQEGGNSGNDVTKYYFKEIIEKCDLINVRI